MIAMVPRESMVMEGIVLGEDVVDWIGDWAAGYWRQYSCCRLQAALYTRRYSTNLRLSSEAGEAIRYYIELLSRATSSLQIAYCHSHRGLDVH